VDETCSLGPLAKNGKQVRIGKGSQTWSEKDLEEKEIPIYK
jgi:hypothetical protein